MTFFIQSGFRFFSCAAVVGVVGAWVMGGGWLVRG
jgi:hypothetical protein